MPSSLVRSPARGFAITRLACRLIVLLSAIIVCQLVHTQEPPPAVQDFTALGQPAIAQKLELSDDQRAKVAAAMQDRINQLIAAPSNDRVDVIARSNAALRDLLTPQQRQLFESLTRDATLRFNFHLQSWPDVLNWFASQADLSLVMDAVPAGTFTYSDSKDYTPGEAIDLLNSVLTTKGFTLVRRERMLIVAKTDGGIPFDSVPRVLPEELPQRGRFEYVSTLFPLGKRPLESILKEVEAFRSQQGQVTPLPQTRQLLVVDAAGRVEAIGKLIASIPEAAEKNEPPAAAPPPAPVLKVHSVEGLDPGAALDTLKELFEGAKLTVDRRAEQVTAWAVPAQQEGIETTINQMRSNVTGENEPRLEAYLVQHPNLPELQRMLEVTVPDARISRDEEESRLLVLGSPAVQQSIREALRTVDAAQDTAEQVKVYEVLPEQTDKLVELLRPLLPNATVVSQPGQIAIRGRQSEQTSAAHAIEQWQQAEHHRAPAELRFYDLERPLDSAMMQLLQRLYSTGQFTQLTETRQLSVVATAQDHEQIAVTLRQIAEETNEAPKTLEFYPVERPLKQRFEKLRANYVQQLDGVRVILDASPDEMAVQADVDGHARFRAILEELRRETDSVELPMHRLEVAVQDAGRLIAMLQERFPRTRFTLGDQNKSLYAWSSDEEFPAVRQAFDEYSAVLPTQQDPVLRTYATEGMRLDELRTLLQPIAKSAQLTADRNGQRVHVWAPEKEHALITNALASLQPRDAADEADLRQIVLAHPLKNMKSSEVVTLLRELDTQAKFATDERGNRVMITATVAEQRRLQAIIEQLDVAPGTGTEELVQKYSISASSASSVVRLVQPIVPDMRLNPDDGAREIIAAGTRFDHEKLTSALSRLQGDGAKGSVRSYDVGSSDPNDVRRMLRQLVPQAIISANDATRTVVVWGEDRDQEIASRAVEQFTTEHAQEPHLLRSYPLPRGMGDTVLSVVRSVAPGAMMDIDQSQGEMVCWGTADEHARVAVAMQELAQSKQRAITILDLGQLTRDTAMETLENTFSHLEFVDSPDRSKLIVSSSPDDVGAMRATLHELQSSVRGDGDTVRVYPIDRSRMSAELVLEALGDNLIEMSVQVNQETNSLIVRGPESRHAVVRQSIEAIVAQLPEPRIRVTEVYQLTHVDVDAVQRVLRRLLPDATFAEDSATATLAATAYPEEHEQIRDVVKQMDIPQQNRRMTEIYRFDRAEARSAELALQELVPEARVSTIRGTNSVVATATEAEHILLGEAAEKINGPVGDSIVKVYPIDRDHIDAEDLLESIDETLRARVAVRVNETMNSLIVRGTAEDQREIQGMVDEIMRQVPPMQKRNTQVFHFQHGDVRAARAVLRDSFPEGIFADDPRTDTLAATANETDLQEIAKIVEQLDQPTVAGKSTHIYRLKTASARRIYPAFSELVEDGRVAFDADSNTLIVTATEVDHRRVESAIEDLNQPSLTNIATKVYSLKAADPNAIRNALQPLVSQGTVTSDPASGTVIVSAFNEEHAQIEQVIAELDQVPGQQTVVRAYPIEHADAKVVHQALAATFQGNGGFSISFQEPTRTIFLAATPKNHDVFAQLVRELDQSTRAEVKRVARSYPLVNMSGNAARLAVTSLFRDQSPAAQVELDATGNTLVVVATLEQHAMVADTMGQMKGDANELEVFDLQFADPWMVENAITTLYDGQPANATPAVSSDYSSQRLFVRGTQDQIQQVRNLLAKMGEVTASPANQSSDVRTIPFRGDAAAAVKQIERLWPRMRSNRIQVVSPAGSRLKVDSTERRTEDSKWKTDDFSPGDVPSSNRLRAPVPIRDNPAIDDPTRQAPTDDPSPTSPAVDHSDDSVFTPPGGDHFLAPDTATTSRFVGLQQESPSDAVATDDSVLNPQQNSESGQDAEAAPTVVIVPDEGRITIASTDHEALSQLESLLKAMSRSDSDYGTGGNSDFAVFLLQNTGATDIRQLLSELFEQLRKNGPRSSFGLSAGAALGPNFTEVAIVADDRLNALIVHGDRRERELIKELLDILDSEDLPNPIVVYSPELVALKNTQASRVLRILQNVYKSQLTTGGGRKSVEIPEGISQEVASVLQQINAAATAPLLTLDVDPATNSIIMRAPPELRREIKSFVDELDGMAGQQSQRNVRVIQLKRSKSDEIETALEQFLLRP